MVFIEEDGEYGVVEDGDAAGEEHGAGFKGGTSVKYKKKIKKIQKIYRNCLTVGHTCVKLWSCRIREQ